MILFCQNHNWIFSACVHRNHISHWQIMYIYYYYYYYYYSVCCCCQSELSESGGTAAAATTWLIMLSGWVEWKRWYYNRCQSGRCASRLWSSVSHWGSKWSHIASLCSCRQCRRHSVFSAVVWHQPTRYCMLFPSSCRHGLLFPP